MSRRPTTDEYADYYEPYVSAVPDGDIIDLLELQLGSFSDDVCKVKPGFAYAEGKWTSEEVFGHVVDIERVFSYRVMCFARGLGDFELSGVDQDIMVPASGATARGLESLAQEFDFLRRANVVLFRSLEPEKFDAPGRASGMEFTVRSMLYVLHGHAEHHRKVLLERYVG